MLTSRDLDAMANALTPALLDPYLPPARPFVLGPPASWGIRAGYTARSAVTTGAAHTVRPGVAHIASALATALGGTIDHADLVRVSDGALERTADPATLLDAWRGARVVVVATALRRFTVDGDDEGPPTDPTCYRQWTLPELQAWLETAGFDALFGGTLPGTSGDDAVGVLVVSAAGR